MMIVQQSVKKSVKIHRMFHKKGHPKWIVIFQVVMNYLKSVGKIEDITHVFLSMTKIVSNFITTSK